MRTTPGERQQRGQVVAHVEMPLETDGQVLGDRERRDETGVLERATEAEGGPAIGRVLRDVGPVEDDPALVGLREPGDEVEDRRLAGAVRADQAEDLAVAQVEAGVVDGADPAEALGRAP